MNIPGVSSSALRQHEKAIREAHQKELRAYDNKLERLRRANDEVSRELFHERNRGESLAQSLGFQSLVEAQLVIGAEEESSYKETLHLVDKLRGELKEVRRANEELQDQLHAAQDHARYASQAK
jgi:predicted RNase H-like nuclease (RuvC/YqgF family)